MYWCAIFLAIGFVFCFFFMEETNYDRAPLEMVLTGKSTPDHTPQVEKLSNVVDPEKTISVGDLNIDHDN